MSNDALDPAGSQPFLNARVRVPQHTVGTKPVFEVGPSNFKIEIVEIRMLVGHGTDRLLLETKLPSGVFPYEGSVTLEVQVAAGNGGRYSLQHFGRAPDKVTSV